jgi:PTH1 family peptidyl-tRNA hydrolase
VAAIEDAQWLVAGLGNPGPAYVRTRHNVGFAVMERLAAAGAAGFSIASYESQVALLCLPPTSVLLLKPQTFMNRSGAAVAGWLLRLGLPAERLVVVHDDLDLCVGQLRVVISAGAGGHRGVLSVQEALGREGFPRVRIGIGRPENGEAAADRVLADIAPEELPVLVDALARAADAVRSLILEGPACAMNRYNVRQGSDRDPVA